ncbi:hypothetical protein Q672_07150 [Marinobacter sp. EVN1]|uniref:aliphatic sulfonate ABC transporter substrate-binding protein n=1 Tax=Marinobacter sp. EVN1 TaxID=1397532 RepID=UPI0003B8E2BE|nr:aliphatic sulfonate ABC transporter substrate-binding protein [Marinobacter sp. EVN1]ERS81085.1 hypothetical protein Q672_07150 [Marinobacter sp. EVN1]
MRKNWFVGLAVGLSALFSLSAQAEAPTTLNVDYAYYSPTSLVVKKFGWLEEEFKSDGTEINWVLSLGSNRALEYLNSSSVHFGSTAGLSAVLAKANGAPIKTVYVYSQPEWTALVVPEGSSIGSIEDLKGKKVAATKGTDPYLFLLRALQSKGLTKRDVDIINLQHPDGRTALVRGDVDAWAGLDPHMAAAQLQDNARLIYRNISFNTYGFLNVNEAFLEEHPETVRRVISVYEQAREWVLNNPDQAAEILAEAANLPVDVAKVQLTERTILNQPLPSQQHIDDLTGAAPILAAEGLVRPGTDVTSAITRLIDTNFAASVIRKDTTVAER